MYLALVLPYAWAVLRVMLVGHAPGTPLGPLRQAVVREWVRVWARLLLFLGGFYWCVRWGDAWVGLRGEVGGWMGAPRRMQPLEKELLGLPPQGPGGGLGQRGRGRA